MVRALIIAAFVAIGAAPVSAIETTDGIYVPAMVPQNYDDLTPAIPQISLEAREQYLRRRIPEFGAKGESAQCVERLEHLKAGRFEFVKPTIRARASTDPMLHPYLQACPAIDFFDNSSYEDGKLLYDEYEMNLRLDYSDYRYTANIELFPLWADRKQREAPLYVLYAERNCQTEAANGTRICGTGVAYHLIDLSTCTKTPATTDTILDRYWYDTQEPTDSMSALISIDGNYYTLALHGSTKESFAKRSEVERLNVSPVVQANIDPRTVGCDYETTAPVTRFVAPGGTR